MARLTNLLREAMAKHLPPSASTLCLLDVNGDSGAALAALREDIEAIPVPGQADQWTAEPNSADAVVAFDYVLNERFLTRALESLRPGGRLIVVNSRGEVTKEIGQRLEDNGYVRILVEAAVECPLPTGVLMRGEKPHTTGDTLARIQQVAGQDATMLDMTSYKGRYVHLLVQETPNLPVWKRTGDEVIEWRAAAVQMDGETTLLAFSSLPNAVGFMQPSVLAGHIYDVNKVAKFSRATAATWDGPVLLNPDITLFERDGIQVTFIAVDPLTAEAPDE